MNIIEIAKTASKNALENTFLYRADKQRQLCLKEGWPMFVSSTGKCNFCGKNVYDIYDGTQHITGCPHCNHSFCD